MMRRIPLVRSALPARVSASARPRRVFGPAAESLWCSHNFAARSERTPAARTFAGPNESNQSKGPEHTLVTSVWLQPVAAFESPRALALFLADPSSLRDFIDRKALLVYRRRSIDLRGRFVWLGRVTRSKALAVNRSEFELLEQRRGTRRQSKRKQSELRSRPESRALTPQMSGQIGIQALCYGDFHLCQQMKVTRLPGRDPATPWRAKPLAGATNG